MLNILELVFQSFTAMSPCMRCQSVMLIFGAVLAATPDCNVKDPVVIVYN